jgi:putative transcriptional regulator
MEAQPYSQLTKGTFLVASPDYGEGIFFRSVVLVCEHSGGGSFGLVINKDLQVDLPLDILQIDQFNNPNIQLRAAGPVQTSQMMLIHTSTQVPDQTIEICPGVYLGGDLPFLQAAASEADGPSMLLCFGYAGWGPGVLEREFLDGNWLLCPATKRHLFEVPPGELWRTLLREMGGKYATLSMIPEDLSLN